MDRQYIEHIAKSNEDKMLLAKLWDKIHAGVRRNIVSHTSFLSQREQEMVRYLFGDLPGLISSGGYAEAERKMLIYLPDYLDASYVQTEDSPITCLRATYFEADTLSHRDFLGALVGLGIARETIGDICVQKGSCDFFVTSDVAPYIIQNLTSAGRTHLHVRQISMSEVNVPPPEFREIKDTLASLRLDGVVSSGFRISRSTASQYILAGKVAVDGLPCEKPDKSVSEGIKISVRGLGKIKLQSVNGLTKKGRISVVIHRYV